MNNLRRSWLAKAKTVQDIGAVYYEPQLGQSYDHSIIERRENRWRERFWNSLPVSPEHRPYFGTRLHDSTLISLSRTKTTLTLRLDNIWAGGFALYLAEVLEVPHVQREYPVEWIFEGVSYVRAADESRGGALRFLALRDLVGSEFLYDWFFEQDERIQCVAQFWRQGGPRGVYSFLMIDCERAKAVDHGLDVFERAFGKPASVIYKDAIEAASNLNFNVFETPGRTPDFIRRRMQAHGFRLDSFRR